jgi:hypothetical protein
MFTPETDASPEVKLMIVSNWLELMQRQTPGPITWDEIVVGYDFGFLGHADIQAWATSHGEGPLCLQLINLRDDRLEFFEEVLWAAAAEATSKAPRPGGQRWAAAQDRWRISLLKDSMEASLSPEALAVIVESIYERVGCPEDMLHLWKRASPWEKVTPVADRDAIEAFLFRRGANYHPFLPTVA